MKFVLMFYIDEDGDEIPDIAISIPYSKYNLFFQRLKSLFKKEKPVKYDDERKVLNRSLGMYELDYKAILEINNNSILKHMPNANSAGFPYAHAKQNQR